MLRSTLRTIIFCSRSYMWPDATVNTCTRLSASSPFATSPAPPEMQTTTLDKTEDEHPYGVPRLVRNMRGCNFMYFDMLTD